MKNEKASNSDPNKVFMARQEFFKAIKRLTYDVLESLNRDVMPLFCKTGLGELHLNKAMTLFNQDFLPAPSSSLYKELRERFDEWANEYGLKADWCIEMAFRSLHRWEQEKKESCSSENDPEMRAATEEFSRNIGYPENKEALLEGLINDYRSMGMSFIGTPGELTWGYDNVQGGVDVPPFSSHWNPYLESRKEFEKRVDRELENYLDKKERLYSHRIGTRTFVPTYQHFEWLVLYRVKKWKREEIRGHDEKEKRRVESLHAISKATKQLESLLKLPQLPKRLGRPRKK